MNKEEVELINRLLYQIGKNDEQALVTLYQLTAGRLLSIARGILKDIYLAEDAVSETFIKVVKYANKFPGGNGKSYLNRILHNVCMDIAKSRNQEISYQDFYIEPSGNNLELQVAVNVALDKLTKEEKEYIILKYYCDMSVREIAKIVHKSKSLIALKIAKAEEKLKNLI